MKYRFVTLVEWNYRGTEEEQYEKSTIYPYSKQWKDYIPYDIVSSHDGVEIYGHKTLREAILHCFNHYNCKGFNRHQKKHLRKVLKSINK